MQIVRCSQSTCQAEAQVPRHEEGDRGRVAKRVNTERYISGPERGKKKVNGLTKRVDNNMTCTDGWLGWLVAQSTKICTRIWTRQWQEMSFCAAR